MSTTASSPEPVVIVGSGPAGIAVAEGLVGRGVPVVIVEGGVARERELDRELSEGGTPRGAWGHEPLGENRRRVAGGTSTAWGGRCIPLDPIDFEHREWIPNSGWPIPYEEYARWLPEAARLLELPEPYFHHMEEDAIFARGDEIDGTPIEMWSPPTDVSVVLQHLEATQPLLTVLRDHHVTGVCIEADRAIALHARNAGREVVIEGSRFVLAAGALENARLLLTSPAARSLPAVGRYYMSHVFATHMVYDGPRLPKATGFFRIGRTYARHRWQLTDEAQRAHRVGNVIGFIGRPPAHGVAVHLDPLTALVGIVRIVKREVRAPRRLIAARADLAVYAKVLWKAPIGFWPRTVGQALRRSGRNRLPMLLPSLDAGAHHLTVQAEHLPHPESRVVLSDRSDRWGVPLLAADIDFHRDDFAGVEAFHEAIERFLAPFGYRPRSGPSSATRDLVGDMVGSFNSNAHHIGTARMGTDAATSVVDVDCRVHGIRDLYVAGSAVFPTSGHANPTLSIVALACRLADHLARA